QTRDSESSADSTATAWPPAIPAGPAVAPVAIASPAQAVHATLHAGCGRGLTGDADRNNAGAPPAPARPGTVPRAPGACAPAGGFAARQCAAIGGRSS